jgi:hypothetical protein
MNRHQRRVAMARNRKLDTEYLDRLFASSGNLNPGLHHVTIMHDDMCRIFKGLECTCTPDMLRRVVDSNLVEVIHPDGSSLSSW